MATMQQTICLVVEKTEQISKMEIAATRRVEK
jgi:hypothetical protein